MYIHSIDVVTRYRWLGKIWTILWPLTIVSENVDQLPRLFGNTHSSTVGYYRLIIYNRNSKWINIDSKWAIIIYGAKSANKDLLPVPFQRYKVVSFKLLLLHGSSTHGSRSSICYRLKFTDVPYTMYLLPGKIYRDVPT